MQRPNGCDLCELVIAICTAHVVDQKNRWSCTYDFCCFVLEAIKTNCERSDFMSALDWWHARRLLFTVSVRREHRTHHTRWMEINSASRTRDSFFSLYFYITMPTGVDDPKPTNANNDRSWNNCKHLFRWLTGDRIVSDRIVKFTLNAYRVPIRVSHQILSLIYAIFCTFLCICDDSFRSLMQTPH